MIGIVKKELNFQDILGKLSDFWGKFGCILIPPAQTEISSTMFHPNAFFGMISNACNDVMYFQPHVASMELKDIKYTMQNYSFLKFQVIIKSELKMPQKILLDSLSYIGFLFQDNNIEFNEYNFENFIFRLKTFGYNVCFNSASIAKMYYVQNVSCCDSDCMAIAISYNIDKILTILQGRDNVWDVSWNGLDGENKISYSDVMFDSESDNYKFINDNSTNDLLFKEFENYRDMAIKLLDNGIVIPAYIAVLKAKYCLDILNLRNHITFNNKINYNKLLRDLVDSCCKEYINSKNM